jgi:hypothetical protein
MHGKLDRHSLSSGYYHYSPYGHRDSTVRMYFGSPFFQSTEYYYDHYRTADPYWYSVPYYIPYTVPVPYVVEEVALDDEVVATEMVEPAPVAPVLAENGAVVPATAGAAEFQLQAEQAFQEGRFEDAARLSNHALVEDSRNGRLHLFASQTFFALEDYPSAAAAVQQAAALLDRSEWGFIVENYQEFYRGDDYVTHMAKLDKYIEENPGASYAYFLRGYHFFFLGHKEAARDDLAMAVDLESRDLLAAELLKMAGGEVPAPVAEPAPEAEIIPLPVEEQPES